MRSAVSVDRWVIEALEFMITRCANTGTTRRLMSSGSTQFRPSTERATGRPDTEPGLRGGSRPVRGLRPFGSVPQSPACSPRERHRRGPARLHSGCRVSSSAVSAGETPASAGRAEVRRISRSAAGQDSRFGCASGSDRAAIPGGIGAVVLDRILGGDHHERFRKRVGVPSVVTWRSLIASSRADCVLGVARLISSAKRKFVKTGPCLNSKASECAL